MHNSVKQLRTTILKNTMYKVLFEIGPNYSKSIKSSNILFQPLMACVWEDSIIGIDRVRKNIYRINRNNKKIEFITPNIELIDPIVCLAVDNKLICLDRYKKNLYVGDSLKTFNLIRSINWCDTVISVAPYGDHIAVLSGKPYSITILNTKCEILQTILLDNSEIKNAKGFSSSDDKLFVITDPKNNTVLIVNNKGEVIWDFLKCEASKSIQLLSPSHAVKIKDYIYIADKYNNRIISIDMFTGRLIKCFGEDKEELRMKNIFNLPRYLTYDDKAIYICDYGNNRIVKIDIELELALQIYGHSFNKSWDIGYPRGVISINRTCFFTDTFRNTIYTFNEETKSLACLVDNRSSKLKTFWPRSIVATDNNSI